MKVILLFIPICLVLFARTASGACANGWRNSTVFPNKCYMVVVHKKIWFDAEQYCGSLAPDAHLTSITNAYENFGIGGMF